MRKSRILWSTLALSFIQLPGFVGASDGHMPDSISISPAALKGDLSLFKPLSGSNLLERVGHFHKWQNTVRKSDLWWYGKSTVSAPHSYCEAKDDRGNRITGLNFATQDYLSLASHPEVKKAVKEAVDLYGTHSAGSAALFGNTTLSLELEQVISRFLQVSHVTFYPTGWSAGYGVVQALIRPHDHVLMDKLAHNCLQQGAFAATQNVYTYPHLSTVDVVEGKLKEIRQKDQKNGILVITESLYSMDSDTPSMQKLQGICHKYCATLLVDMAHDLGCIGKKGLGFHGEQDMVGKIDLILGSFSKTCGTNGGFIATQSLAVKEYLTYYSGPATFSTALSPIQAAVALKSFSIIESKEGEVLRNKLMNNISYLREALSNNGFELAGSPSSIVPIIIGNEGLTRIATKLLIKKGIIVNPVEFPAVAKGAARLRVQVMATHTKSQIDALVEGVKSSLAEAKRLHADVLRSRL